jgi:UDP-glucose 4-epimerase
VTGGAGYIGSHTVQALLDAGREPVIFDDFSTGHREFVGSVPLFEGDVCRSADLRKVFEEYPITGVIHFAGRALVNESVQHPESYYQTNVVGGLNLLGAMRDAGVSRLIFSSTCATYGVPGTARIAEDHPQIPINPYGETKLAFERSLDWYRQAHGIEFLALRYFNAAGADPEGRWGEDHDPETHLIPLVLEAAADIRPEVRIYGTDYPTPDGTCVRDYIHVSDLATAHVKGLEKLLDGSIKSQALNLGTGRGASVREVIDAAQRVTDKSFKVVESDRRAGDPPQLVAAADRAQDTLEWTPTHSGLSEIVETAWSWVRKRRAS